MRALALSEKHLVELRQAADRAAAQWFIDGLPETPVETIRALDRVLLFLRQGGGALTQARQVTSLGFLFGEQLVRKGWRWCSVSENGSVNPSVAKDNRACLVIDAAVGLVNEPTGRLIDLFHALEENARPLPKSAVEILEAGHEAETARMVSRDVVARLLHILKTLRMWDSPEALEAVAQHFIHVLLMNRPSPWSFEDTQQLWTSHGGPFAQDAEAHARMRERMWGIEVERSWHQVVTGYASLWAGLVRESTREPFVGPWIETLLDGPHFAQTPDRLSAVLFALMGFGAVDSAQYVQNLEATRERIGGHRLRAFYVVGPKGPTVPSAEYARTFDSWDAVSDGIHRVLTSLQADTALPAP